MLAAHLFFSGVSMGPFRPRRILTRQGQRQGHACEEAFPPKPRVTLPIQISSEAAIPSDNYLGFELGEVHGSFAQRHPRLRTCAQPTQPRLFEHSVFLFTTPRPSIPVPANPSFPMGR